jgi:hypothetical protein
VSTSYISDKKNNQVFADEISFLNLKQEYKIKICYKSSYSETERIKTWHKERWKLNDNRYFQFLLVQGFNPSTRVSVL